MLPEHSKPDPGTLGPKGALPVDYRFGIRDVYYLRVDGFKVLPKARQASLETISMPNVSICSNSGIKATK